MVKRKGAARGRDEQRWERERRDEHAFLFAPDERCLGRVERDEWDLAMVAEGGNFVEAARQVGVEVPRGTRARWGRLQEAAIARCRFPSDPMPLALLTEKN